MGPANPRRPHLDACAVGCVTVPGEGSQFVRQRVPSLGPQIRCPPALCVPRKLAVCLGPLPALICMRGRVQRHGSRRRPAGSDAWSWAPGGSWRLSCPVLCPRAPVGQPPPPPLSLLCSSASRARAEGTGPLGPRGPRSQQGLVAGPWLWWLLPEVAASPRCVLSRWPTPSELARWPPPLDLLVLPGGEGRLVFPSQDTCKEAPGPSEGRGARALQAPLGTCPRAAHHRGVRGGGDT